MVEVGDPVVFAVLKDRERETDRALGMVTIKGVREPGEQGAKGGAGRVHFLREDLFLAADTTV